MGTLRLVIFLIYLPRDTPGDEAGGAEGVQGDRRRWGERERRGARKGGNERRVTDEGKGVEER